MSVLKIKPTPKGEGGTTVVANPTLEGTEPNLTGLEVAGTKYKVPEQKQADWNQDNNQELDYIKNKPTIPSAQIQSDWNQSNNQSPDFIKNKPNIPDAQIQSNWTQTNSNAKDYIKNKPNIPTVNNSTITFTQGGVNKGSFNLNQSTPATIALDAGGGGGSSKNLHMLTIDYSSNGTTFQVKCMFFASPAMIDGNLVIDNFNSDYNYYPLYDFMFAMNGEKIPLEPYTYGGHYDRDLGKWVSDPVNYLYAEQDDEAYCVKIHYNNSDYILIQNDCDINVNGTIKDLIIPYINDYIEE